MKCITSQDSSEGAALEQWSCNSSREQQFWVGQGPGGSLVLHARNGQRCIDIAGMGVGNGTKAQLWSCGYWLRSQLFSPIRTSMATSSQGYYELQAGHVSKCLDCSGLPNSDDGANLQLWSCSGQANQAFLLPGIVL